MSTMKYDGTKIILPRSGPDDFWQLVKEHYAGNDPLKWKNLAILALRENAGWPLEVIGQVFGHPKGHVSRCLAAIKRELRAQFRMSPNVLEFSDEQIDENSQESGA